MDQAVADRIKEAGSVLVTVPGLVKPIAPFQQKGVSWLYAIRKGILADDVGLGKTVQALATAALLKDKGQLGNVYIACLGGHEKHWLNMIKEWMPGVFEEVGIASGKVRGRKRTRRDRASLYNESPRIIISNYHLLRNDIDMLEGYGFGLVILDEATAFKNHDTKLFEAVKKLCNGVPRVIALTATPFEKSLIELFAIQDALGMELFGTVDNFRENYEIIEWLETKRNGRLMFVPKHVGYQNLDDFKNVIRPIYIRREEHEVQMELPEVRTKNIYLEMAPSQLKFYEGLVKEFKASVNLGTFTRMVQACDAPSVTTLSEDRSSPKLDEMIRQMEDELEGFKVVIFARWHHTVELIGERLDREGYGWVPFTGRQLPDERNDNKERFINDKYIKALVTTTAGEKGVDGLQVAKGMIAFNQLQNPQRMRQVVGRIRRMGSPHKSVLSINLMMEDSVEDKLWDLMMERAELFDAIFDSTSTVDLFTDTDEAALAKSALESLAAIL